MRAFIAVNLDEKLRRSVGEVQDRLRAAGADVKWVAPDYMHLTLKFLGWVEEARVPAVAEAARAAVDGYAPFRLRLEGVGGFPSATAPRVVWVGIEEGAEALCELAQRVEQALEPLDFAREERRFSPHVTVGRVRSSRARDKLAAMMLEQRQHAFGEMEVERVELMRSDLRPTGPIYTSQCEFLLTGAQAGNGEG